MFIVVIFFLIYGVEVYFKVRLVSLPYEVSFRVYETPFLTLIGVVVNVLVVLRLLESVTFSLTGPRWFFE